MREEEQRGMGLWGSVTFYCITNRTYATVVRFRLHNTGSVSLVKIEQSSGNASYDAAGKQAVLNPGPLPSFPPDLSHAYVHAHITLTGPSEVHSRTPCRVKESCSSCCDAQLALCLR